MGLSADLGDGHFRNNRAPLRFQTPLEFGIGELDYSMQAASVIPWSPCRLPLPR